MMAVPTLCLVIQEQGRNQTLCMSRAGWGMFVSVASVLLFPDKAQPGLQGQMTVTRPRGLLEVDVDSHPGDSTQAVQESESCFSNRLGAEQPREPQVTEVFLLSGQFKTNRYTSNRLSQTQQEILCESQARRLPHPKHTTSSVHLLTEDRETETADCSGGARAAEELWARTKGRREGGYDLNQSSDSGLHSQKTQATARYQACSDALLLAQQ